MLPPHLQSVTADMQEENDDAAKVAYMTRAAQEAGDIMMEPAPMQQDLAEAIEWAKGKTPQSIMTQRDSTLRAIRKYGAELAREGELEKWCSNSLCFHIASNVYCSTAQEDGHARCHHRLHQSKGPRPLDSGTGEKCWVSRC